jgi:hypothetical protein
VHYAHADDHEFIEWWVGYLRDHGRIDPTTRTTVIHAATDIQPPPAPRLVVSMRDGHSDRSENLRLGQSLILHESRLTALDTEVLHQRFHLLRDPFAGHRYPATTADRAHRSLAVAGW